MQTLESYVQDRWQKGVGATRRLQDPTTEEILAEVSSEGIDLAAACRHGREVGGPALRAMTFKERGALLKALSGAIHEHREELIDLAVANGGNTRGDAKFDIDGGTGTLAAYASFAKGLGDRKFIADGEGIQLGRTARFWGQHIRVPREGVAVHINAFNFPVWGMCEKMACALLAGVPVIEKPGTPTALVAYRTAQIIVESGILPPGAFQFLAGSVGDLLDHLGSQDCLAFTGSSATGRQIRGHAGVVANNVRVNVEADSLNAAILAPDVGASDETYASFLSKVALDMTQKTGQKCTAVRRILVPADRVEEVKSDLVAELARTQVGDPRDKANRMGPVASKSQFEDVQAGIQRLASKGEVACGGDERVGDKGFFLNPTLLVFGEDGRDVVNADEVFGPVASLLPYDGSAAGAASFVREGGGGLVASAYSNDADWIEEFVLGAAAWAGRLWIESDRSAEQSLPPGMVLPGLVHGGPGRAGGGEELGGVRGLEFYMQRTALQGFKGIIDRRFGPESNGDEA